MVHSGSASQMKTSPTGSPHRTVPATAPPLQVAPPLVPPPGDTSDQGLTQTPTKHLSTDLTVVSPQPSTPADAHPVGTPATALTGSSSPASSWSPTQTTAVAQGPVNGRTSGRKRTPKACDCCGPNSTGHNVKTSGRGKGRGRGALKDTWDTPKKKVVPQLTQIKSFDLTTGNVEEAKDETDTYEKVQTTLIMADTHPPPTLPPVPVMSPQDAPLRNCSAPETACTQTNEDTSIKGSGVSGEGEKGCGVNRDVEMRLSGMPARRVLVRGRGRGLMTGAMFASKLKVEVRIKGRGSGCVVTGSQVASDLSMVAHGLEENKNELMEDGVQTHPSMFKSPLCNGDTVNLTDSESEEETKDDNGIMSEVGNGLLSFSRQSGPASRSDAPHDLDPDMDQTHDGTDQGSLLVALSNGSVTTLTDINHTATPMEVEPPQCPITVDSVQHHSALSDHRLYCHPGTWETEAMEEVSGMDPSKEAEMSDEDGLERLTDMVHDFLESFYIKYGSFIPLSETDVLEHLKKNGNSEFSKCGLDVKQVMSRYRSGLASAPVPGFMVMYNKHSLGLEDLGTLEDQNWLNDQIINMYGELIMEATQQKVHFFNSFFHKQLVAKGYDGVKRWTKKVDLFSKWLLLIPIHLEIHWSLVTVTMATKTISYYDSQGIVFRHTTDNIMKYLQSEAREKEQTAFQKGWKITIIKGIPQQRNDSDCGVFVLEYCRRLSVKQPLLFSQEDMPLIRKRIYKEMCDCRLND